MKTTMKNFIVLLAMALTCLRSSAQPLEFFDGDAEAYIQQRGILDRPTQVQIHKFISGLKRLNLWSSLAYLASYRDIHNSAVTGGFYPIVGFLPANTFGTVPSRSNGLEFDGNVANYVELPNDLSHPITAYTVAMALSADITTGAMGVFGSYNAGSARGPAFYVHGSPTAGYARYNASQYFSNNGSTDDDGGGPADLNVTPGLIHAQATYSGPQFVAWSFSATKVAIYAGIGVTQTTTGSFGSAWNNNSDWILGRTMTGQLPFKGTIAMLCVWNRQLEDVEISTFRRLYAKTLGYDYLPRINAIFEGDSLTAGQGSGDVIARIHLWTNSVWGIRVQSKNIALSGAETPAMVTDVPGQLLTFNSEFDFLDKQYYFLWGGENDLAAGTTANVILNNLKQCWGLARTYGYKVIACTVLPSGGMNAAARTQKTTLNSLIRANRGGYDFLVDLERVSALQNTNSANFASDHVHLTTAGQRLVADEIIRTIPIP